MFLSGKKSTVSHYSSTGTVVLFLLTMFQTLDNDSFVFINTQPNIIQGEHWIMTTNSCQNLFFLDSLGRKRYSFLKQQYEQMMPEHLQSHPSVCGFYTIYAVPHLVKLREEENRGVHDVNVLSIISNYK